MCRYCLSSLASVLAFREFAHPVQVFTSVLAHELWLVPPPGLAGGADRRPPPSRHRLIEGHRPWRPRRRQTGMLYNNPLVRGHKRTSPHRYNTVMQNAGRDPRHIHGDGDHVAGEDQVTDLLRVHQRRLRLIHRRPDDALDTAGGHYGGWHRQVAAQHLPRVQLVAGEAPDAEVLTDR